MSAVLLLETAAIFVADDRAAHPGQPDLQSGKGCTCSACEVCAVPSCRTAEPKATRPPAASAPKPASVVRGNRNPGSARMSFGGRRATLGVDSTRCDRIRKKVSLM